MTRRLGGWNLSRPDGEPETARVRPYRARTEPPEPPDPPPPSGPAEFDPWLDGIDSFDNNAVRAQVQAARARGLFHRPVQ